MKTSIIIFLILLSFNVKGQNYIPKVVYIAIKDTAIIPLGYSEDSNIITNNEDIDSIFKKFNVKSMIKLTESFNGHRRLDSLFEINCECNERELRDSLKEYNRINGNNIFHTVFLIFNASPELIPNDFNDDSLEYLDNIHAKEAWDVIINNKKLKTIIGISDDNGFQLNHEDLKNQIMSNRFTQDLSVSWNNNDNPHASHGTFCAGVVGMQNGNDTGYCSLGGYSSLLTFTKNKTLINKKVFQSWVNHDNPRVISCSWGWGADPDDSISFQNMFRK